MISREQAIAANDLVAKYLAQPEPSARKLYCGFFGCDPDQIEDTSNFVNVTFHGGWGDWTTESGRTWMMDYCCGNLAHAKSLGVTASIVTVDFCVYNKASPFTFVGHDEASIRLRKFFDKLKAHGVLNGVKCLYPVDEPEINGLNDQTIAQANAVVREVAATYPELAGVVLGVTYSDHRQYPGLASYRPGWVGVDSYDHGSSILQPGGLVDQVKGMLAPDQMLMLFPAGANPWRQDPVPFMDYARADPKTVAVIAFMYMSNANTIGIGANGMAPAYTAAYLPFKEQA